MAIVIIGGALPRLNHIDKSIWAAEAWVANSVLTDTPWEMFRYKDWLQTTPPLFLLILRETVHVVGVSVGSFRAVPFGFSILSLVLIAWLAQHLLETPFAVICTALVALSPPAVVFSKEVKQYTADVAATCLLLIALWRYLELADGKRYFYLCAALVLALFVSYPAITFIPLAFLIVAAKRSLGPHQRETRIRRVAILALLTGAICAVNYWLFVKPNTSPLLTDYWGAGYPRFGHFRDLISFYVRYFLGMGVYFYVPIAAKDFLISKVGAASIAIMLLLLTIILCGLGFAVATLRHNRRHLRVLALCFGPFLSLVVLNAFRLYPVNSRRLTLFMLPCISLSAAVVLQSLWSTLASRTKPSIARGLSGMITTVCVLVVLFAATDSNRWGNYWFEDEDTAGAFRYIRAHAAPEDTIYIHASIEEPAKLYFRILQWSPEDVRYGNTGWICCTRTPEPKPVGKDPSSAYVVRDFERVMAEGPFGKLWLVYTGREGVWVDLGRNEPEIIDSWLDSTRCRKDTEQHFARVTVQEFACAHSLAGQ